MKENDERQIVWEQNRNNAITFGKFLVKLLSENYLEPTRAGTRKGESIGFSLKKRRAALLMILFNPSSGLGLKEIAKIAGVSPGVLRMWHTETAFKKVESETCNTVRGIISGMHDVKSLVLRHDVKSVIELPENVEILELMKRLPAGNEKDFQEKMRYSLLELLPFFNPLIGNPLIQEIAKKIELSTPGYVGIGALFIKFAKVRDEKSLKKWRSRSEVKALTKAVVENWFEMILDPLARKEIGEKNFRQTVEQLKTFVWERLDF